MADTCARCCQHAPVLHHGHHFSQKKIINSSWLVTRRQLTVSLNAFSGFQHHLVFVIFAVEFLCMLFASKALFVTTQTIKRARKSLLFSSRSEQHLLPATVHFPSIHLSFDAPAAQAVHIHFCHSLLWSEWLKMWV